MAKTKIVTTYKTKSGGKKKKFAKRLTSKVHKTHKGYPMRGIVKSQMTYKRRGRKK